MRFLQKGLWALALGVLGLPMTAWLSACSGHSNDPAAEPDPDAGEDAGDDTIPTVGFELAQDVTISEVALFQAVKVPLMKDGKRVAPSSRKAQPIVGREGILRVYVTLGSTWEAKGVVAEVVLKSASIGADRRLTASKTLVTSSKDENIDSTFNVEIPTDAIASDTTYTVALKVAPGSGGSGSTEGAQYPSDPAGDAMEAQSTGETVKLMLVPVKYNADGSGRLPDMSDAQVELYKTMMYAMYPVKKKFEVTIHDPYPWSSVISRSGSGWDGILRAIQNLRTKEGAANDVYYYGLFMPAASFGGFCGGGCVSGLSSLAMNPGDAWARASVGLGYNGDQSGSTMQHEVAHAHGRAHAPCGPGISGIDPGYPYSGAKIGSVGYDITAKKLYASSVADIMSYCPPTWISDYNYNALMKRIQLINGAMMTFPSLEPRNYRIVLVDGAGKLTWAESVTLKTPPLADERKVTFVRADGSKATVTGMYYPYDHIEGGQLLVPEPTGFARMRVDGFPSELLLPR